MKKFIIASNLFLFFPVVAAFWMREWIYFALALAVSISSPLYHYIVEYYPRKKRLHDFVKKLDWSVAICAYAYMFYYIFTKVQFALRMPLALALSATIIFFWYGFKVRGYKKLHPWFHVSVFLVSSVIVISK